MGKIILLKGLPASGKSTRAKEMIEENKSFVRVNKDLIRKTLHFGKYSKKNEELVKSVEKDMVHTALLSGKNIIVDDMNYGYSNYKEWEEFCYYNHCNLEEEEIKTPWKECIVRDMSRYGTDEYVGEHVIINSAMRYKKIREENMVICDIDGTLANAKHRMHYVEGDKKDWKSFFAEVHKDKPIKKIIKMVQDFHKLGNRIIIITGRNEICREETVKWLKDNDVPFFTLFMRDEEDHREDFVVKNKILETYFDNRNKIIAVIEDRPQVIVKTFLYNYIHPDKIIDVGNDSEFIEERKELNYWTSKNSKNEHSRVSTEVRMPSYCDLPVNFIEYIPGAITSAREPLPISNPDEL